MNYKKKLLLAAELFESADLYTNLHHHPSIKNEVDFNQMDCFFSKYSSKYNLELFCFSENTFEVKKNFQIISALYNEIKSLEPFEFEKTAAILCKQLNYSKYAPTKMSRDEGIDFIAERIDNDGLNSEEILFGQCKHLTTRLVSVGEIRELAGAVTLFKNSEFMSSGSYASIAQKIKSHSSLKTIFVTSSFFSVDACEVCNNSSIIQIDIIDLIHLFVIGMKNNIYDWADEKLITFKPDNFHKEISKTPAIT